MIRPYRDGDARFLAPIHTAVFPGDPLSINAFGNYVTSALDYGGKAWILEEGSLLGYALVVPVPGLPHIVELNGCIAPPYQRRGLGGRLLNHLLNELQGTAVRQVSHQVRWMNSPAARFLCKNDFYVEHEETIMRRNNLIDLSRPSAKEGAAVITLPRSDAVETFSQLYAASFSGLPWDQPFARDEIEAVLEHAEDMLFLTLDSRPVAFAWLHLKRNGLGLIEPLGVLPEIQGQGFGRFLLAFAIQELAARGADRAQIGAWCTNQPAITLYQSSGFKHHQTITFLARDL
jgi:ribosomal protein S18 acetylase RimI-like enzyme